MAVLTPAQANYRHLARRYARYRHLVFDLTAASTVATSDVLNPGLRAVYAAVEKAGADSNAANQTQALVGSDGQITFSGETGADSDLEMYLHAWCVNDGATNGSSADHNADGSLTAGAIKRAKSRYGRYLHRACSVTVALNDSLVTSTVAHYGATNSSYAWEGAANTDVGCAGPFLKHAPLFSESIAGSISGICHMWVTRHAAVTT